MHERVFALPPACCFRSCGHAVALPDAPAAALSGGLDAPWPAFLPCECVRGIRILASLLRSGRSDPHADPSPTAILHTDTTLPCPCRR